ncbi:aldo/keto reductase [Jeotgalibacillus terrae]|uniref:Aldo/keto reductase n=1 Tax=Jeotgalibacillus terrae TaxID=587735 RepID=A0ABW5ZJQ3_9BACL|nr:aldo/keto reductase [Jeotgalibacillus terrae]MBM7579666.1 aryl-alcohol dehydrogenase-like predicted oxidoreductase [Jeotgalibacillus terrae]
MKQRYLGTTGIQVSEVGFGAWQLGNEKDWGSMTDAAAIHLVSEAMDAGCNFFDTAPNYGSGKSEELLGKAFKGKRDQVIISSKCGHHQNGEQSFDPDKLIESVEGSLQRLQTDYLDSLLLHNPPFSSLDGDSPQFEVLKKLKSQGKIRAYGASVDTGKEMYELLNKTDSQVIEVMFNLFHQEPADAMKSAAGKGVGVITKVPLDSGWLSGKYNTGSTFSGIRSRWSADEIEQRGKLVEQVRTILGEDVSMAQAALQFILSHTEVSTIIPGAKDIQQFNQNRSASEGRLSPEIISELKVFWRREVRNADLPW